MVTHEIKFPIIHGGCIKGNRGRHATGISISYIPRTGPGHFVDIESINSQGDVTTDCRIPLPPDPDILDAVAEALIDLAMHIKNGTA